MKKNNTLKSILLIFLIFSMATLFSACSFKTNDQIKEEKVDTTIQFYRNATMKIQYAGKTILTDPMLAEKGSYPGILNPNKRLNPISELTVSKEEIIKGTDFMLVSHTHIAPDYKDGDFASDHMDPVALNILDKTIPIYLQAYDLKGMENQGFKNLNVVADKVNIENIFIERFDGLHVDDETWIPMIGESSGYVLKAPNSPTILWSGDTLLTDNVKNMIVKHQPDIIILHSGGAWLPKDDKGNKAILLMGIEDTISVAKLAPNSKIVAIHMEALDHCPVTRKDLREAATRAGISKDRLIIPQNGEILKF